MRLVTSRRARVADRERRTAQLAVAKPTDRAGEAQGDPMLIGFGDQRKLVREVAGSHPTRRTGIRLVPNG
jgi:hypothetical protein